MRICIVRNAEFRTNASMRRVVQALSPRAELCLLTRSRFKGNKGNIIKIQCENGVNNYEIQLRAEMGKGLGNLFQLLVYQFLVLKWLLFNDDKYEVVHAFDLDAGVPTMIASWLKRKRYVYHIADFYVDSRVVPRPLRTLVRKLEYLVISKADVTIVCTEERKEQIRGSNPKKLVVIHNTPAIDLKLEVRKEKTCGALSFAYVGSLNEERFIRKVVDVFKAEPDLRLYLGGMGPLEDYVKEASNEYDNIEYLGMVDYESSLGVYSQCDVMFAMYDPSIPNHRYSAPNKVYEAMLLGRPIIVSAGTGVDKLVAENRIGFVIGYSSHDFINLLNTIRQEPELLKTMGRNARKAHKKYSWGIMERRLVEIYDSIADHPR